MTDARRLLILLLSAALLVACNAADLSREAHPATLANTSWRAISIGGHPTIPGSEPTALFKVADISGSGGCNDWFADYDYDPGNGRIALRQIGMTARGCLNNAVSSEEAAFATALTSVNRASIDPAGRLVLSGPGGEIVFEVAAVSG